MSDFRKIKTVFKCSNDEENIIFGHLYILAIAISILYITEKAYQWLITQHFALFETFFVSTCDVCREGAGISVFHVTPKLAFFQVKMNVLSDFWNTFQKTLKY